MTKVKMVWYCKLSNDHPQFLGGNIISHKYLKFFIRVGIWQN